MLILNWRSNEIISKMLKIAMCLAVVCGMASTQYWNSMENKALVQQDNSYLNNLDNTSLDVIAKHL